MQRIVTVLDTALTVNYNDRPISTQKELDTYKFQFDDSWIGYVKTAVFYTDPMMVRHVVLLEDNIATIPWEVLVGKPQVLYIGVFGTMDTKVKPTTFGAVRLREGSYIDGIAPLPPTPDVYQQIIGAWEGAKTDETIRVENENSRRNNFDALVVEYNALKVALQKEITDGTASVDALQVLETEYANKALALETTYAPRLGSVESQLAENVSVLGGDNLQIWQPPIQPKTDDIIWVGNKSYLDHLALWEGLRAEYPTYITRTLLGKDSSNVHDIFKYVFAPQNYEKTLIITANTHGAEKEGQKILYRFLYHVCHDSDKYSQLNYIRNKVRLIVVPIVNPAGLVADTRQNANGVDLNRNFNYNWNSYVSGDFSYKGTAPLSEKETQYLDAIMSQYSNEGATALIDVHATEPRTAKVNTRHYYVETSRYAQGAKSIINQVISAVTPPSYTIEKTVLGTINPSVYNQATNVYGLHSVTPEWEPGVSYGLEKYSAEEMTQAVKFIGNMILQFAALKHRRYELPEPSAIEKHVNTLNWKTNITAGTYEPIANIEHVFPPEVDGLLYITAELQFTNPNVSANNYFYIHVEQIGNQVLTNNSPPESQSIGFELVQQTDGKPKIFSTSRMVLIYAKDDFVSDVSIKLMLKADVGQISTRRVRLHAMFVPTKGNPNYVLTGSENESVPTKIFPPNVSINY